MNLREKIMDLEPPSDAEQKLEPGHWLTVTVRDTRWRRVFWCWLWNLPEPERQFKHWVKSTAKITLDTL